ncbi:hypothetical protein V8G54_009637 [Vigna mungo]|uniref:Uncharacterized protein n=1 Tax=Vigna mungo TaxID=3915 RepID=A0AAQ3NVK4_VIGMU
MKRVKLGADNPSPENDTKLWQRPISKELKLLNESDPKTESDSIFSQFVICRRMRFGKLTSGRHASESQLLFTDSDSSNSCLCCIGNLSLFNPLIIRVFSDIGR